MPARVLGPAGRRQRPELVRGHPQGGAQRGVQQEVGPGGHPGAHPLDQLRGAAQARRGKEDVPKRGLLGTDRPRQAQGNLPRQAVHL